MSEGRDNRELLSRMSNLDSKKTRFHETKAPKTLNQASWLSNVTR